MLRHAQSFVSPSAVLAPGSVVLAMACVGAASVVEEGAIVNMGAILDYDCTLGACAHLAPGAVVKAGNRVPPQEKIDSGCVLARAAMPGKGMVYMSELLIVGCGGAGPHGGRGGACHREMERRALSGRRRARRCRGGQMRGLHRAHRQLHRRSGRLWGKPPAPCLGGKAAGRGLPSAQRRAPTAIVSPSARLGEGCLVLQGAIVNTAARLGRACLVNAGALVTMTPCWPTGRMRTCTPR